MLVVQKFGGSSLADGERILCAASRAAAEARKGNQVVVVVSAQGDTTDLLIQKVKEMHLRFSDREMDAYLASGEQMSAGLMAMALESLGLPAVSLTGCQAGIQTDGVYGNARILSVDTVRIRKELAAGKVVVVAGFQGASANGDITTLGRGGSDTTAVALAAWLRADACRIFTDVDGVYDRDPRKYKDAVRYRKIGYDAMLALIAQGAQVLHDRSVELAKRYGIPVEVLSSFTGKPGTLVCAMDGFLTDLS